MSESDDIKRCFTPIPSRRFMAPIVDATLQLCPSMDLMVFGLANSNAAAAGSSMLWLHRTVSGQKLATLSSSIDEDEEEPAAMTHACWRPDGRLLALMDTQGHLRLYNIEDMLASDATPSSLSDTSMQPGLVSTLKLHSSAVTGVVWAHMGRPHPAWPQSDDELEQEASWESRRRYLDRQAVFLPPADYPPDHESAAPRRGEETWSVLPTSQTPLSVLGIASVKGLDLYLHGRYPILQGLELPWTAGDPVDLVVSMNLTHLLVRSRSSPRLALYSLPALTRERYNLQPISALSCAIANHLQTLTEGIQSVAASYKSSIKPMDIKLDALARLLHNYSLTGPLRDHLVPYILSGRTKAAPNLQAAMDQFFTGVQMNDQLLQRMERSLTVAVANVESQLRQAILRPAQALLYQVSELYGLARLLAEDHSDNDSTTALLRAEEARSLFQWSSELFLRAEAALTELIDARFRLRDLVAWLRSTGSHIKAQGTAVGSVQRQNAQKRRASDAVVQRMLQYLQKPKAESNEACPTESVLGLRFSEYLADVPSKTALRPSSPKSVKTESLLSDSPSDQATLPLPMVVKETSDALERLLLAPREYMTQTIYCTQLELLSQPGHVTMTTRIGKGGVDLDTIPYGEDELDGFFVPKDGQDESLTTDFREWMVLAAALTSSADQGSMVQIHAMPLTWTLAERREANEIHGLASDKVWSTTLQLPPRHKLMDVGFYGDDGKSTLSSGLDSGTGKERRQALGLVVESESSLELWMVPYDDCSFAQGRLQTLSKGILGVPAINKAPFYKMEAMPTSFGAGGNDIPDGVVYAKTRVLAGKDDIDGAARLLLCGSRGVGAVVSVQKGATTVDLLDLEEDEEPEEEEDEEEGEAEDMEE